MADYPDAFDVPRAGEAVTGQVVRACTSKEVQLGNRQAADVIGADLREAVGAAKFKLAAIDRLRPVHPVVGIAPVVHQRFTDIGLAALALGALLAFAHPHWNHFVSRLQILDVTPHTLHQYEAN